MLIHFLGIRGTVPTAEDSTVCFLVDNKFLFDISPEFVFQFTRFCKYWGDLEPEKTASINSKYGPPSFSKIEYVFLSHLHWDHWGGLRHLIHRAILMEAEMRDRRKENPKKKEFAKPLRIFVPEGACKGHRKRLALLLQMPVNMLPDDAELLKMLLRMELGLEIDNYLQFQTVHVDKPIKIKHYEIIAAKNKHLQNGSFSYKIISKSDKLDVEKAKEMGVPFNSILSRLQRNGEVMFNGRVLKFEDIFNRKTITLGYSGDSPVDYSDCDVIIHDSSYLTSDSDSYHLDSHASLDELVKIADQLESLKILIPVHFSYRFKKTEIKQARTIKSYSCRLSILLSF
ncbi:MAG: MBL fold metallo-hydrolase [Candidatus Hodarchaeales archaeon]